MPLLALVCVFIGFFIGKPIGEAFGRWWNSPQRQVRKFERLRNKYYSRAAHSDPSEQGVWEDAAEAAEREADRWRKNENR